MNVFDMKSQHSYPHPLCVLTKSTYNTYKYSKKHTSSPELLRQKRSIVLFQVSLRQNLQSDTAKWAERLYESPSAQTLQNPAALF